MKSKFKNYFMRIANETAGLSHARRLQVGAIIVKDDRIISIGYNGMPAGWDNDCEFVYTNPQTKVDELVTRKEVLHAETNAVSKLAKSTESGDGASIFVTHMPCMDCAKLIYQSGINTVYYSNSYKTTDGIDFLKKSGVTVEQINNVNDS
jgi:dCMP deaminase